VFWISEFVIKMFHEWKRCLENLCKGTTYFLNSQIKYYNNHQRSEMDYFYYGIIRFTHFFKVTLHILISLSYR